jgi:hypothetical protein
MIMKFRKDLRRLILPITEPSLKFARRDLKIYHRCHICSFQHKKVIRKISEPSEGKDDRCHPSSAEAKNARSYTSIPASMLWCPISTGTTLLLNMFCQLPLSNRKEKPSLYDNVTIWRAMLSPFRKTEAERH